MTISYREIQTFTEEELRELFASVGWMSAAYPERLVKAMRGADAVISAWDGEKLIGLVNVIDDGELTAYAHYLLVNPIYHHMGIGKELVARLKKKYEGYLYLLLIAEKKETVSFYEKLGFTEATDATAMQIVTK